jgi:hypothetical protein
MAPFHLDIRADTGAKAFLFILGIRNPEDYGNAYTDKGYKYFKLSDFCKHGMVNFKETKKSKS